MSSRPVPPNDTKPTLSCFFFTKCCCKTWLKSKPQFPLVRHSVPKSESSVSCLTKCHRYLKEEVKKGYFFSRQSTKAFSHPPSDQWTKELFFVLKQPETDFDFFFFSTMFGQKEPYFQANISRNLLKTVFSPPTNNTQYTNTLILIFGFFVLNKICLTFQRLQKNIEKTFFQLTTPYHLPPPLSGLFIKKRTVLRLLLKK